MFPVEKDEVLVLIRALSWYLIDQLKEGDDEAAKKTAKLLHILSHEI